MPSRSEATIERKYTYMVSVSHPQKKKWVSKLDLDHIMSTLHGRVPYTLLLLKYELGKRYKQLHIHSIIEVHRKVQFKKEELTRIGEFKVDWKPVFNLAGAINYMSKQSRNADEQAEILEQNHYAKYRFTPPPDDPSKPTKVIL